MNIVARTEEDRASQSIELGLLNGNTPIPGLRQDDDTDDKPRKILLLCERCWRTFSGWGKPFCPECGAERPEAGWATLPYTFRERYLFWEPVGRGGMGAVFLAYDEHQEDEDKKAVAVKVVPQSTSQGLRSKLTKMFEREACAAAMLAQSPAFVKVTSHDVGVSPAYMVMEYVQWPTLRQLLRRKPDCKPKPLSPVKVARIAVALLRGVSMMHYHRIVHRDLKPDNIFVRRAPEDDGYEIKILDFGVWTQDVNAADAPSRSVTGVADTERSPVGTFSYMSPEQMCSRPVGVGSDIHTVGSLLWELATGRVPYPMRKGDEMAAIRERLDRLDRPPPKPKHMPEGLYEILVRALAREADARWESAEEMRSAFKVWLAEQLLRSRSQIDEASHRLEALQDRAERMRSEFSNAGLLNERIDRLNQRVAAIRAHAEEADLESLDRCVSKAEVALAALAREVTGFAKNVQVHLGEAKDVRSNKPRVEQSEPHAGRQRPSEPTQLVAPPTRRLAAPLALLAVLAAAYSLSVADFIELPPFDASAPPMVRARPAVKVEPVVMEIDTQAFPSAESTLLGNGHSGGYVSVAYSPDGAYLASAGADLAVMVRDAVTGVMLHRLVGHEGVVFDLRFSPNGRLLASSSEDGTVRLWEAASGRTVRVLDGAKALVRSISFSRDGTLIAGGVHDGTTLVWDVGSGDVVRTLRPSDLTRRRKRRRRRRAKKKIEAAVRAVAFAPEGVALATGNARGEVVVWDPIRGAVLQRARTHDKKINALTFSPDGRWLASASDDTFVDLIDVGTGKRMGRLAGHGRAVRAVAFNPDGSHIATAGYDRSIRLWQTDSGNAVGRLEGDPHLVYKLAYSPDGTRLAAGSHDKAIRIWDTGTNTIAETIEGREGSVLAVAVHPLGKVIASAGFDRNIELLDARTGELLHVLEGHSNWVHSLAFSDDGQYLVSGSNDRTVKIWSVEGRSLIRSIDAHESWIRAVAFSADGQSIASASDDGTVKIWNAYSGTPLATISDSQSGLRAVALSADGKYVAAGGDDKRLWVWRVDDGTPVLESGKARGVLRAVAFSPDGATVATGGDDRLVRLIRIETGETILGHEGHDQSVHAIAFSPDGTRIASGSLDRTIKLWSATNHELITTLEGHELGVEALAFLPSGERIVSGGNDSTRRLWDVDGGQWIGMSAATAGWVTFGADGER